MNKLVSRNPVLRFKEGRKIEKFLGGGEPQKKYYLTNNGGLVYETPETIDTLYSDAVAANLTNPYNVKTNSGYKFLIGSFDGGKTYYRLDTRKKLDNNSANFLIRKAIKPKIEEVGKVRNSDGRDTKGISNGGGTRKDWKAEYTNNFLNTLSNDEITHLKLAMGSDNGYLDPSKMLEFLIANLGKGSLGNYGKEGVDGRWGNVSRDAWELYKKKYISTPKQEEIFETPAENNETPITTPTKYTTNNTYMDKTQFRDNIGGLGILSNADLINWMHLTGAEGYDFGGNQWAKQFRSDVDRALGGDYSDANIRKTFNTAGNWGRGFLGGGDLSDFQNAMATNAGVWNGAADAGKLPTIQFDRSATREWLRNNAGGSAYAFTGDLRKAVRNILNGLGTDQDKELIKGNADLAKALTGYFKTGGTMNILPSRNIIERFKLGRKITFAQNGVSFKEAWNLARANKQRYFNWNGRMYNSKAAGNDTEYESFVDNMNEMSALLPTDRQPKHLGWERNNPTSSEVRGNNREIKKDGTENTLTEIIVSGKKRSKKSTPSAKIVTNKNKNKATRNMSGTWGQGSGGGQQYANLRQYAFERSAFDKMRTSSSSIFGSTAYKTDNRGRRYVERDGSLYYDDGTYYNPQTRKTGKYTYTPGGLFSRNLFTLY